MGMMNLDCAHGYEQGEGCSECASRQQVLKVVDGVKLFARHFKGRIDLAYGPHNAEHRRTIMTLLTASPKPLPLSKCGVTALRNVLAQRSGLDENHAQTYNLCQAEMDKLLENWALGKSQLLNMSEVKP